VSEASPLPDRFRWRPAVGVRRQVFLTSGDVCDDSRDYRDVPTTWENG